MPEALRPFWAREQAVAQLFAQNLTAGHKNPLFLAVPSLKRLWVKGLRHPLLESCQVHLGDGAEGHRLPPGCLHQSSTAICVGPPLVQQGMRPRPTLLKRKGLYFKVYHCLILPFFPAFEGDLYESLFPLSSSQQPCEVGRESPRQVLS